MTAEASVDNSKIEAICRECGNTLPASEVAEFFNEEQLILNFWSCTNCGFQFETEEKSVPKPRRELMRVTKRQVCFRKPFFHHRDFECASVQAVGYEDAIGMSVLPPKADICSSLCPLWANNDRKRCSNQLALIYQFDNGPQGARAALDARARADGRGEEVARGGYSRGLVRVTRRVACLSPAPPARRRPKERAAATPRRRARFGHRAL